MVRYITKPDIKLLAYLPLFWIVAWFFPPRLWNRASLKLAKVPRPFGPFPIKKNEELFPGQLPSVERAGLRVLRYVYYLADLHPFGWQPECILQGENNLADAVDSGRGVILWIAHTNSAGLITKKALCGARIELHHLSRLQHGGSNSIFGMRYLNAVPRFVENRYLVERIPVSDEQRLSAMKRMRELLSQGKVVSITATPLGRQLVHVPLFGGLLPLATGAPALAHASGAPLLPVFCTGVTDGEPKFRVVIGEPIYVDCSAARKTAVTGAAREFAKAHQNALAGAVEQFRGFGTMVAQDESG